MIKKGLGISVTSSPKVTYHRYVMKPGQCYTYKYLASQECDYNIKRMKYVLCSRPFTHMLCLLEVVLTLHKGRLKGFFKV